MDAVQVHSRLEAGQASCMIWLGPFFFMPFKHSHGIHKGFEGFYFAWNCAKLSPFLARMVEW